MESSTGPAKGLNWGSVWSQRCLRSTLPAPRMGNGYNTGAPTATYYFEWCQDYNKPMQAHPFGDVAGGGRQLLPDPTIFAKLPGSVAALYHPSGCNVSALVGNTGTTPPPARSRIHPIPKAGLLHCGTRTTSAKSHQQCFPGGMLIDDAGRFPGILSFDEFQLTTRKKNATNNMKAILRPALRSLYSSLRGGCGLRPAGRLI